MPPPPVAAERPTRRLSARGWVIFVVAAVAVVIAAVVGIRGLLADPIESVAANGTATLHGTWEPYTCTASSCRGYLTAGARSVFIVFPSGCAAPVRGADITVQGRRDTSLGTDSYRATACAG